MADNAVNANAKATHRWIGSHPFDRNGVPVAPGDFMNLTDEELKDPLVKEYVDSGLILTLSDFASTREEE